MQAELGDEAAILGVNAVGYEAYDEDFTAGFSIPWLQDTVEEEAWERWGAEWRDVWVLDADNQLQEIYSLNEHDLGVEADYQALLSLIRRAAS